VRDQDDAFVRRVSDALRGPVEVSPGFDERVMAELRASVERAPRRHRLAWLTRPRTVRLSPLAGLALAAGLVGVAVVGARRVAPPGQPAARAAVPAAPTGAARLAVRARLQPTRFALAAPGARTVAVVGQFNDWDPSRTPLVRGAGGIWEAAVPLGAGRYEYAFLVDGARVVADPAAEETAASDFGAPNSVVTVGGGVP
jgi:hypothetical protein